MDDQSNDKTAPCFAAAEIGALAHLYRGESKIWRNRLDMTGNWAISPRYRTSPARPASATATAFLSFALSNAMKTSRSPSIASPSVLRIRLSPSEAPYTLAQRDGPPRPKT